MTIHDKNLSRRTMLKGASALVIGLYLPAAARAQSGAASVFAPGAGAGAVTFAPNAFIRVGADDVVTVLSKHIEFGQGPFTGLATLVAEEMDADWSKMRVEHAPSDPTDLQQPRVRPVQGTGGSTAIANSYEQMRKAGATARALLVSAAAEAWNVPAGEITDRERRAETRRVEPAERFRRFRGSRREIAGAGECAAERSGRTSS